MINWRNGKAGFIGGSKRIIKGFFDYTYSITSAIQAPTIPGLEYTLPDNRLHFTMSENKLHYTLPDNRLHFTMDEED